MLSDEELDRELQKLFTQPDPTVAEVIGRITAKPLPPHLAKLVAEAARPKLFPLGGRKSGLLELQDELDAVVAETDTPEAAKIIGDVVTLWGHLKFLMHAIERPDLPEHMREEMKGLVADILKKIGPGVKVVDAAAEFFARKAKCQDLLGEQAERISDELFQVELNLSRAGF